MEGFGGLAGIGALAAGIGFAYSQFKTGSNKAKEELIHTLELSLKAERDKNKEMQDQINELRQNIGKLQGLHESNEKKIKEYLDILQGKSPEQVAFMTLLTEHVSETSKYMRETSHILAEIKKSTTK